jgi:hypothetical protein
MRKKEIHQQEVLKRNEEQRIAKEKRDFEKAERARAFAIRKQNALQKKLEKAEKSKQRDIKQQLIIQERHNCVYLDYIHLLETKIPMLIAKGYSNELIEEIVFFEIRNASFSLASTKKYEFNLPVQGTVLEHVNGRTNIGIYGAYLVLTNKIKNGEDYYNFLLRFGCIIKTTKQFNDYIAKFQNQNDGAISPEIYIREYEKYFNYKLTDTEKLEFSKRFLFTEYGSITKNMIIDIIRNKMQK